MLDIFCQRAHESEERKPRRDAVRKRVKLHLRWMEIGEAVGLEAIVFGGGLDVSQNHISEKDWTAFLDSLAARRGSIRHFANLVRPGWYEPIVRYHPELRGTEFKVDFEKQEVATKQNGEPTIMEGKVSDPLGR